ncbi:hypothetical protein [Candidatus Electrothrix sp.]|uniref:hypothetical protein n=1 Tax=Candidatus Electrothrix sp. TaxID=2170559 RepID=UPI004056A75A
MIGEGIAICKKEISRNAESCPYCGEPLKEEQPKQENKNKVDRNSLKGCSGCLVLVFGGFVVMVIFSMFTANSPTSKNSKPSRSISNTTTERVSNSAWDGSVYQVKAYLKRNLKDPDSFEAIEWSSVAKTDNGYMVRCKYRAKNSYGGYNIEHQIFILNKKGNVISVLQN